MSKVYYCNGGLTVCTYTSPHGTMLQFTISKEFITMDFNELENLMDALYSIKLNKVMNK